MPASHKKTQEDLDIQLTIDESQLDQLSELTGQRMVRSDVWDDTVFDAFDHPSVTEAAVDVDIYLEAGARFELFAVICYTALNGEPLGDRLDVVRWLNDLMDAGAVLEDVAADTEDNLVLVLATEQETLFLNAGAWSIDEWEELPE
jgi:hypothetical protein